LIELSVILILGLGFNIALRWTEDDLIFDARDYAKSIAFNEKFNNRLAAEALTDEGIDNYLKKIP